MNRGPRHNKRSLGLFGTIKRHILIRILQHRHAIVASLAQYLRFPIGSLLTTAVIAVALSLPSSFLILFEGIKKISDGWDDRLQFTVFLQAETGLEAAKALHSRLSHYTEIETVQLINKEIALEEYKRWSGFDDIIGQLDENPLPHTLLIKPHYAIAQDAKRQEQFAKQLQQIKHIDQVQYDRQWIKRLLALFNIIEHGLVIFSISLAMAILLIVGNTIRLSIHNRKQEIEVAKLFGATNTFIQRPFLYNAVWYGGVGAILAWLLLNVLLQFLQPPISKLARLYDYQMDFLSLGLQHFLLLFFTGVVLSVAGAWISVRWYIHTSDVP